MDQNQATPVRVHELASAATHMGYVSLRRLLFSRQTLVCLFLLALAMLAATMWSMRRERTTEQFVNRITPVYINFLLPAFCLSYATACVAAEREEQTLLYSLLTPVPRPIVYAVRLFASLVLSMTWTVGGMALLCRIAGPDVWSAFPMFWPIVAWWTLTYVCLFGLFSVVFRRATVLSLVYVVFLEELWGSVPGTAKRVAVSFYTRCLFIDAGERLEIGPPRYLNLQMFMPISASAAVTTLVVISATCFLIGAVLFAEGIYLERS